MPQIDQVYFHEALERQAMPVLERLAAEDDAGVRAIGRFERDDPPPYESVTSTEWDDGDFVLLHGIHELPSHIIARMEAPLTDQERRNVVLLQTPVVWPEHRYEQEARAERVRIEDSPAWWCHEPLRRNDDKFLHVIIRHNIKRRWEKLGVWNAAWGVPSRDREPEDKLCTWQWPWQQLQGSQLQGSQPQISQPQSSAPWQEDQRKAGALVERALRLRQTLRRGEHVAVIPQSHLKPNASESQAESFLLSRPWFLFRIECNEEMERFHRIEYMERIRYKHAHGKQVADWWEERGHPHRPNAWKWQHESPSPPPEDLSAIEQMEQSPLDAHDMEFTPSEVDALESVPPPTPPRVEFGPWPKESRLFGNFEPKQAAAQTDAVAAPALSSSHMSRSARRHSRASPGLALAARHGGKAQEGDNETARPLLLEHDASPPPPHSRRPRPRDETDHERQPEPEKGQQPRRSARIAAANKRAAESVSDAAPSKKLKRGTMTPSAGLAGKPRQTRELSGGRRCRPSSKGEQEPQRPAEVSKGRRRGRPRT